MVSKSTAVFSIILFVLAASSEGQRARYFNGFPRFFSSWFHSGDIWSRARSIMPRLTDVASDATAVLALPTLAVLAFSAVWPHHKHYKSKREAGQETAAPVKELSEHMMNIYYAAMESDECMQRIACEVGAAARSLKSENFTSMMSLLNVGIPSKYSKLFEKFKVGVNDEKCEKLGCSLLDQQ